MCSYHNDKIESYMKLSNDSKSLYNQLLKIQIQLNYVEKNVKKNIKKCNKVLQKINKTSNFLRLNNNKYKNTKSPSLRIRLSSDDNVLMKSINSYK